MQLGSIANKDRRTGQKSLFGMGSDTSMHGNGDFGTDIEAPQWSEKDLRQAEKERWVSI